MTVNELPCHPCPHDGACCKAGTPLALSEAARLRTDFGEGSVEWDGVAKEWRTALANGACFFREGNACRIHDHAAYPVVCAGFPFRPDESEVDICPELLVGKHPELDALFDPLTRKLRTVRTGARS